MRTADCGISYSVFVEVVQVVKTVEIVDFGKREAVRSKLSVIGYRVLVRTLGSSRPFFLVISCEMAELVQFSKLFDTALFF
jgi:hypothetical protein